MRAETLVSFLLACAVVFGAVWVFSNSISTPEPRKSGSSVGGKPVDSAPPPPVGVSRNQPESNLPVEDVSTSNRVFKCIDKGQTVYSNKECAIGAKPITLHDSAGVLSPPKENLEDLTRKRKAAEAEFERTLQTAQSATPAVAIKVECDGLKKYIEQLDAMARQPQSGQMQDWIKQQKANAQSRQFAIHC